MYPKRSDGPMSARSKTPSGIRNGPGGDIRGTSQVSEEALAKERDQKFKVWLQNKALKDKAFEYLSKLDSSRASERDSLIEVGIALCAVDRMLGVDEGTTMPTSTKKKASDNRTDDFDNFADEGGETEQPRNAATASQQQLQIQQSTAKKTLKAAWMRWAMEFHTFSMLLLSPKDLQSLSAAVQEFLFSEADIAASGGGTAEDELSREKNILPSLKYFFPAVPKPGEKPRPLTADQKAQNVIYMRELRKLWRKAQQEMNDRLLEFVAKGLQASEGGSGGGSADRERSGKERSEKEMKASASVASLASSEQAAANKTKQATAKALETMCLQELSLKTLRGWIEEDEDKRLAKDNEATLDRLKNNRDMHDQFVRKKDSLRIRMPVDAAPMKAQPMLHGRELEGVTPAPRTASTTVELMAGLGLKYVHATSKGGGRGREGDLEKSRQLLLKQGFVAKENFNDNETSLYNKEKRENVVIVEQKRNEAKLKEESAKAFDEWTQLKEMRDQALNCLKLLPKPAVPPRQEAFIRPGGGGGGTGSTANSLDLTASKSGALAAASSRPKFTGTAGLPLNLKLESDQLEFDRTIAIGKGLKKVDRTLFSDWATWAAAVLPANTAAVLWDYFPPTACDVHSAAYSQVRDGFLKLLRPGLDYRETFLAFVEKTIFAKRIERFKQDKGYNRAEDEDLEALDRELESLRKEWLQSVAVSKSSFRTLLRQMGIVMKDAEMRSLIDAFDANGDGVITLVEFLDFCGPKRDRRGGSSVILGQKCCWTTSCKVTGMSNAYSVSNATRRFLQAEDETKRKASSETSRKAAADYEDDNNDQEQDQQEGASVTPSQAGRVVIRRLANGEQRMCVELKERPRREETLRRLGLLGNTGRGKGNNKSRSPGGDGDYSADEDHYDDDNHDEYGDDFDSPQRANNNNTNSKSQASLTSSNNNASPCAFSTWSAKDRRNGLKYLLDESRELRQEEQLKAVISSGTPPKAPKFWVQFETKILTKATNRNSRSSKRISDGDIGEELSQAMQENDLDGCHDLQLFWSPASPTELVSFYSIESAGAMTINTKLGDARYVEIFRDPPEADSSGPDTNFALNYIVRGLQPGTTYLYRIRAFSGFGPSEYTYKSFTTLCSAPPLPRTLRIAPESVILRWSFNQAFFQRLAELKKLFLQADRDQSGVVSREELAAILNDRASEPNSTALRSFLEKITAGKGLDAGKGFAALFDLIEGDDDGGLSWREFESFFVAQGWTNSDNNNGNNGADMSQQGSVVSLNPTGGGANKGPPAVRPGDIVHVVERCESEFQDLYKEALRTTAGHAMIKGLQPGQSYRFRVFSINVDGLPGPPSPPILVHTLLETPSPPFPPANVKGGAVGARSILLQWKARNFVTNTRTESFVNKLMGDWTHAHEEKDGGVSIEAVFARYDKDKSGDIDSSELALVLEDLGVDVTEERLTQAFETLDANGDGIISFEEFATWWRREEVSYVLKRSDEIQPTSRGAMSTSNSVTGGISRAGGGSVTGSKRASSAPRGNRPPVNPATTAAAANGNTATAIATAASTSGNAVSGHLFYINPAMKDAVPPIAFQTPVRPTALPLVVYRENKTRFRCDGLIPNSLYQFRIRYIGPRSNSMLSPALAIMTAPLPPSAPVLVAVGANMVRVKWYPAVQGAFKFAVHLRQVGSQSGTRRLAATLPGTELTTANSTDDGQTGWYQVYLGQDPIFTAVTLSPEMRYECRVVAINFQGTPSIPSETITFTTLARAEAEGASRESFVVECTGDICVGDTILITERLFLRPPSAATGQRETVAAGGSITIPAPGTSSKGGRGSTSGVRQSVTSLNGGGDQEAGYDGNATISSAAGQGTWIGDRVIAAAVTKDNYRSSRDSMREKGISPADQRSFGSLRRLWLEVVWTKSSNEAAKRYEVKAGEVLERMQGHLEQFEVWRCPWRQEENRLSLRQEWEVLKDCFIPMT